MHLCLPLRLSKLIGAIDFKIFLSQRLSKLIGAIDFKIFENFLSQRLLGVGIDALISDISSNSAGDHFLLRVYM